MNKRIKNSIKIIDFAISNGISIYSACEKQGFSSSYVKNVKMLLNDSSYSKYTDEEKDLFFKKYGEYLDSRLLSDENKVESQEKKSNNESLRVTNNKNNDMVVDIKTTNRVTTLEELLEKTNVDKKIWGVKEFFINKWDVTSFKDGKPVTAENYQVKARLEKNVQAARNKSMYEIFAEMVDTYSPPTLNIKPQKNREENLLEISIFDLHIGKLAWHGETGENYDSKIARKRFLESITTLLHRANGFDFNRILFPVGNDFFNSDNKNNTTTAGTPQDEDLRWQKTFSVGVQLLVDGINLLKQTGVPVDVIIIPGNHDFERSYYMGSYLEAWFRNDEQVSVNNGASPRKYYVYGDVLLGFTHGGEEKQDTLGLLMANDHESKPHWSKTKFHEWHLGHQHRKKTIKNIVHDKNDVLTEDMGVTVRYLSSLTGTEEWHHKKGYIGQIKAADAFVWNNRLGFVAHLNSNYIIED